jgi:hypothetical protein
MNFVLPRVNSVPTQVTCTAKRSLETCDLRTNVYKLIPTSNKSRLLVKLTVAQILRHLWTTTVHCRIQKQIVTDPYIVRDECSHILYHFNTALQSASTFPSSSCMRQNKTYMHIVSPSCDVITCVYDHLLTEQPISRKRAAPLLYNETICVIMSY